MRQGEADEKERILLEQFRFEKQYLEAAKVAFDGNYRQMFMQVLLEMVNGGEREVTIDEGGMIAEEPVERDREVLKEEVKQLVEYTL